MTSGHADITRATAEMGGHFKVKLLRKGADDIIGSHHLRNINLLFIYDFSAYLSTQSHKLSFLRVAFAVLQ